MVNLTAAERVYEYWIDKASSAADLVLKIVFAEAITESGLFKAMELRLISLGFQAGASDEVMEKLAEQYEEKSTDSVSHIVSILEPTIVIVLSILVGLVLLSVMMPLLGLLSEMIA